MTIFPDEAPLRVMALHALLYCERLFYLEEIEEIRMADTAVYVGRRMPSSVEQVQFPPSFGLRMTVRIRQTPSGVEHPAHLPRHAERMQVRIRQIPSGLSTLQLLTATCRSIS